MGKALSRLQTSGYIAHKQNALGFDVSSHVPLLASWQKAAGSNSKFVIWNISHLHFFLVQGQNENHPVFAHEFAEMVFPGLEASTVGRLWLDGLCLLEVSGFRKLDELCLEMPPFGCRLDCSTTLVLGEPHFKC